MPVASQENSSKKRAADKAFGIPKGQCDLTSMLSVSREKIWEQLCRFIVATNSSFSLVENEEFVKFVRLLKPGFVLPKRKQDAGALLDELSEKELAAVKDNSSGKFGTVALDGWTSASAEPVLGVSVSFDNTTYLMDTIDTSGAAHTAAYVSEVCLAAVSKVEESLNIKVAAYVTDNASNMKAARDIVETKRPEILCYGCQAHQLNLLSKDLYKGAPKEKIIDKVIGVLKWFRVTHKLLAKLRERGVPAPPLPTVTRWNSIRTAPSTLKRFAKVAASPWLVWLSEWRNTSTNAKRLKRCSSS